MLIGSGGKGDQQCGLACGGQFSHSGCTAAGEDQVRGGKARGHVVKEGTHLPAFRIGAAGEVGLPGGFDVARTALVQNGEPGNGIEQAQA